MHILLAHCFYRSSAPSGEDAVYRREKALLENAGHQISAFEYFNDDISIRGLGQQLGAAKNCIWSPGAKRALKRYIKHTRPDVVHFHNTFPQFSLSVYQACRELNVPVVQTLHNYRYLCANGLFRRDQRNCEDCVREKTVNVYPAIKNRCYRQSLGATLPLALQISLNHRAGFHDRLVDRYICLTDFAKSKFVQAGFAASKITVKPNFIDATEHAFSHDGYALFVGRLSSEKGVATLLEAWKSFPGLKLKVVGDGELRDELTQFAVSHQLNVEFLGLLDNKEVLSLVKKAWVQIIPSECYEGFPAVVAEAFACATPVIASRLGGLEEIITHRQNGLHFTPGDAESLSDSIAGLLESPEQRQELALKARQSYEQHYSAERNLGMLESIYAELIRAQALKLNSSEGHHVEA